MNVVNLSAAAVPLDNTLAKNVALVDAMAEVQSIGKSDIFRELY